MNTKEMARTLKSKFKEANSFIKLAKIESFLLSKVPEERQSTKNSRETIIKSLERVKIEILENTAKFISEIDKAIEGLK